MHIQSATSTSLPRIDDCLDSGVGVQYFTTLDCNSDYWQLPIAHEDKAKTDFVPHAGHYQWMRMPFGQIIAPASFQRAVYIILSRFKWKSCLVHLNDVNIFSKVTLRPYQAGRRGPQGAAYGRTLLQAARMQIIYHNNPLPWSHSAARKALGSREQSCVDAPRLIPL